MTRGGRGLLGAAVGSLIALMAHPASRPYVLVPLRDTDAFVRYYQRAYTYEGAKKLPRPDTLEKCSLWLQSAAERSVARVKLTKPEVENTLAVAQMAAKSDPNNAFWKQIAAVYLNDLGRKRESEQMWAKAARCNLWNDYQSDRLMNLRSRMAQDLGAYQAWEYAFVYYQRSNSPILQIENFSRALLAECDLQSLRSLNLRYNTLMNGVLARKGSKSIASGLIAARIVEFASHPKGLVKVASPRRLYVARSQLRNAFQNAGLTAFAERTDREYRENDGWVALVVSEESEENPINLLWMGVFAATIPAAFLFIGVLGTGFFVVGLGVQRISPNVKSLPLAGMAMIGTVLGIAAYAFTGLVLLSLAVAMSVVFLSYSPVHERKRPPENLGPLWQLTLLSFATLLSIVFGLMIIGATPAGYTSLNILGVPHEFLGPSHVLGALVTILISMVLLVPPAWSVAQRIATMTVLGMTLKRLGVYLITVGLGLAVLTAPLGVYLDRSVSETYGKLASNEPLHYLQGIPLYHQTNGSVEGSNP